MLFLMEILYVFYQTYSQALFYFNAVVNDIMFLILLVLNLKWFIADIYEINLHLYLTLYLATLLQLLSSSKSFYISTLGFSTQAILSAVNREFYFFLTKIKRCLLLERKVMTNLDSILKSRDITLPTKVCLGKAMVFPVVMYGCESWTIKKAEHRRIDAFELRCWGRLLRVPWTARTSNQSILKEISPEIFI